MCCEMLSAGQAERDETTAQPWLRARRRIMMGRRWGAGSR